MNKHIAELLDRYPALAPCSEALDAALDALITCYRNGGKLLICGNGGSASDAQHIVGELMKNFILPRPIPAADASAIRTVGGEKADFLIASLRGALPATALVGETAFLTAFSNDVAPEAFFAQQVYGYGKACDVLFGITTSGNSENVVCAAIVAKAKGMKVIGLTGEGCGKLEEIADVTIAVPEKQTYRVQELHLPVYHALCIALEDEFFGEGSRRE